MKRKKVRITPYVDQELRDRLRRYCVGTSSNESRVVTRALHRLLEGTDESVVENRLNSMRQQLVMLEYELGEIKQELVVVGIELQIFMMNWLTYSSQDRHKDPAEAVRAAKRRYEEAKQAIRNTLVTGYRLVEQLELPADWFRKRPTAPVT
jgi:hypothetical protein